MKVEQKTYYYFDDNDLLAFREFLRTHLMKLSEFAEKCGISTALLSLIIHGKRALTKEHIENFKKNGFDLGDFYEIK